MRFSKELKIGVFVVVVLTASFFLINYLRGEDIMNREIELVSQYDNVEGLVASAPVFIKGYKAGKVSEVVYQPESGNFKVTCSIKKEFAIPADSRMTIYAVDIMGGKGVRIDLGSSEDMAKDGDMLQPAFEPGLMDGLSAGIGPLLDKVNHTLDSLGVTVSGVNRVLSEKNTASISRTVAHLERTMADVRQVVANVEGKSKELDQFVDALSAFAGKLDGLAAKVDTTMTGVKDFVGTLNESDIDSLVVSFRELLENINDPNGTIGKLLNDGSVYDSVDSLLNDVDTLVRKIQENPKKYIRISVF
ncbi:MAG: MCE family protein [Bacteroidales bacterium]|nr:MCE family protein [Bacteroidales bacterium]